MATRPFKNEIDYSEYRFELTPKGENAQIQMTHLLWVKKKVNSGRPSTTHIRPFPRRLGGFGGFGVTEIWQKMQIAPSQDHPPLLCNASE